MPPTPPPLPPETRTVGQLVAETIRLYGERFWPSLVLGLPLALISQVIWRRDIWTVMVALWVGSPLLALAYARAAELALRRDADRATLARAALVGSLVFLPVPVLMRVYLLPAAAWLALFGLAVPVVVAEGVRVREALRRALGLARADYVHALGSLATLTILFVVTVIGLDVLLRAQADIAARVGGFLSALVLSPVLFLGAALLYVDQEARSRIERRERLPRR